MTLLSNKKKAKNVESKQLCSFMFPPVTSKLTIFVFFIILLYLISSFVCIMSLLVPYAYVCM